MTVKKNGINFFGSIGTYDGIGRASLQMLKLLKNQNNVDIYPVHRSNALFDENLKNYKITKEFLKSLNYRLNFFFFSSRWVPHYFKNVNVKDLKLFYNIGFWFTESSEYSEGWCNNLKYFNEIWTSSNFSLDKISQKSNIPILKMSHYFFEEKVAKITKKTKTFNFLNISNVYSDIERKNVLQIVKGFINVFGSNQNVCLNLVVSNAKLDSKLNKKLKTLASKYKNLKIITNYISNLEIKKLYNNADVYISLHRSEGFGITIADAIELGIPIIVTGYSGNLDFCDPSYNIYVKHRLIKVGHERLRYRKEEKWAQPDQKDFEKKILKVFKKFDYYKKKALDYRKIMVKEMSKKNMSLIVKKRLGLIFREFDYENNMLERKIKKNYQAFNFYDL